MAGGKYLDSGGLEYTWNKIKKYLTSWKYSNFGAGTYDNDGNITNKGIINLMDKTDRLVIQRGLMELYSGHICVSFNPTINCKEKMGFSVVYASTGIAQAVNNTDEKINVTFFGVNSSKAIKVINSDIEAGVFLYKYF